MSMIRYENHRYARLNNHDDNETKQTFHLENDNDNDNQNDECNEEIELQFDQQHHQQQQHGLDGHLTNSSTTPPSQPMKSAGGIGGLMFASKVTENIMISSNGSSNGNAYSNDLTKARFKQFAISSVAIIILYLSLSICLTFYQKALVNEIQFPLSIVCYHLIIKLLMSAGIRAIYKCIFGVARIQLDWQTSLRKMAPTGIVSGIDIGFSNWGLKLVPISMYTISKSSTIVFILLFAIILGLEKKSWSLVSIVSLIAVGLFMFTYKSLQFDALGFIFILVASLSGGIRWTLAQFVMQKLKLGLNHPLDMIYHMQPWMILPLIPLVVAFEGDRLLEILTNLDLSQDARIYLNIFKINCGAVLAFCMEISEFLVLSQTSSLTLSIAGIFKDIFQLALAVELYGDQFSRINLIGLVVCLAGICCHLYHKYKTFNNYINDLQNEIESTDTITSTNTNTANNSDTITYRFSEAKQLSSQTVPLLNPMESDDEFDTTTITNTTNSATTNNTIISNHHYGGNTKANASDTIFDVLKHRDVIR